MPKKKPRGSFILAASALMDHDANGGGGELEPGAGVRALSSAAAIVAAARDEAHSNILFTLFLPRAEPSLSLSLLELSVDFIFIF